MKKILMFITILFMGIMLVGCTTINEDAKKFNDEYESLNGETTSSGKTYATLDLDENNTIKYKTSNEIISILENKTGIIYFGFPTCPWCRSMISTLLEVAKEKDLDVNYLNIYEFRSTFVIENGKAKLTKEGEEDYYKILDILDNELEDFNLKDAAGAEIYTGEKRLYAPTVVFVKEGKVKGIHVATLDSQTDPYVALTNEQKEELKGIYLDFINKIK
jgi:thiol-disulfide isomerase/thioredoxin